MIDTFQFIFIVLLGLGFLWLDKKERTHYREFMHLLDSSPTFIRPKVTPSMKPFTVGGKKNLKAPKVNDDGAAWRKEHDA